MSTASAHLVAVLAPELETYGRWRLTLGIVGRTWLWFLSGCLLVTLIPIVFGWRPYLIESGSMEPRISMGDVVLSAPTDVPDAELVGHIVVFADPEFPGRVKTHRIVSLADAGGFVTKGDANPTEDTQAVLRDDVSGLGRLLVRFVGLPAIWFHQGQWLFLALFLMSLLLAALVVNRDHEDQVGPPEGPRDLDDRDPSDQPPSALPAHPRAQLPTTIAAAKALPPGPSVAGRMARTLLTRSALVFGLSLLLLLPATAAAFASNTKSTANSWSVPLFNYTTEAKALGPKIYYKLDEASGANATDSSGNGYTGTYNGSGTNFTYGVVGALTDQSPNLSVAQKNANACIFSPAASSEAAPGPATYSEIVWFKVPSGYALGGKLVGMENQRTTSVSTQYDRHIYMDGIGKLYFGVWLTAPGTPKTISTPASYNDGAWHMAVSTMGVGGMRLYVDGVLRASDPNTVSETFGGTAYWRFGCGNLSGWGAAAQWSGPNAPATSKNYALQGSLDEVAIYSKQLTGTEIGFLYFIR